MNKLLLLFLCCIPHLAVAADVPTTSLFFSPEETQAIETLAAKSPHAAADNGDVHLGAVFYYAPDDWVIWLQGEKWLPATDRADLHVLEVTPASVKLAVASAPGLPLHDILLKPYQTYQLSTGSVVEGSLASSASSRVAR